jgi:hypothetical protein
MNVRAGGQKRLVVVGATGMVGGYALRYALDHPVVERATAIRHRKLGISHSKLAEVLHRDFADCTALAENSRVKPPRFLWLGAYSGSVSVTVGYVEFARLLRRSK